MIRFLFLLIVFALGMAAAGIAFGQMHHLRQAVPDRLPAWTAALPGDAGLRAGHVDVPAQGIWPALRLGWEAAAPGAEGPRWDVRLTGEGVDLAGVLTVGWWPDTARLDGIAGSMALEAVEAEGLDLRGLLALRGGMAEARGLMQTPLVDAELTAELRGVRAGGAEFGGGPVSATLREDLTWQVSGVLDGGASPVAGGLRGQVPGRTAELDVIVESGQSLPTAFRSFLQQVGQAEGDGWRVVAEFPLY